MVMTDRWLSEEKLIGLAVFAVSMTWLLPEVERNPTTDRWVSELKVSCTCLPLTIAAIRATPEMFWAWRSVATPVIVLFTAARRLLKPDWVLATMPVIRDFPGCETELVTVILLRAGCVLVARLVTRPTPVTVFVATAVTLDNPVTTWPVDAVILERPVWVLSVVTVTRDLPEMV